MRKIILLIALLAAANISDCAAQNDSTFCRWSLQQEVGMNFPFYHWETGAITDDLISLKEPSPYWNFFDGSYNFSPKLSLRIIFQTTRGLSPNQRKEKFAAAINNKYDSRFFIQEPIGFQVNRDAFTARNVSRFFIGFAYNHSLGKFKISPGFSVGLTSYDSDIVQYFLKEKGTNQTFNLLFNADKPAKEYFTYIPNIQIAYPILKRIDVYVQGSYYYNKYDFMYEETLENIFEATSSSEKYNYQGKINTIGIGLGLRLNLNEVYQRSYLKTFK